jgi:aspartyl/glutamyl-tRNA(Asn/Gln) amidotransferase C subunit
MAITIEFLKDLAHRLKFDMTQEQYQTLQDEFHTIIHQMDLIGQIKDIDNVAPMTFPFEFDTAGLREDVAESPLSVSEVIQNAKDHAQGQIKTKKVVG